MTISNSFLILGSNGFLGSYLKYELIKCGFKVDCLDRGQLDLENNLGQQAFDYLTDAHHKFILICAAITDIENCFQNQVKSHQVNVHSIVQILEIVRKNGVIPIFFSSDYVFAYKQQPHKEDDLKLPLTSYGHQKLEVERYIEATFPQYLIFRTSKLMSKTLHPKNILFPVINSISKSQKINCFTDQWLNPVFIEDIAEVVKHTVKMEIAGTFHLGTKRIYTRMEIGKILCTAMGKPIDLIVPINMSDINFSEPRPNYNTLDCSKIEKILPFKFLELNDIVSDLKNYF